MSGQIDSAGIYFQFLSKLHQSPLYIQKLSKIVYSREPVGSIAHLPVVSCLILLMNVLKDPWTIKSENRSPSDAYKAPKIRNQIRKLKVRNKTFRRYNYRYDHLSLFLPFFEWLLFRCFLSSTLLCISCKCIGIVLATTGNAAIEIVLYAEATSIKTLLKLVELPAVLSGLPHCPKLVRTEIVLPAKTLSYTILTGGSQYFRYEL